MPVVRINPHTDRKQVARMVLPPITALLDMTHFAHIGLSLHAGLLTEKEFFKKLVTTILLFSGSNECQERRLHHGC